jgi:hypothetical protein
MVKSSSCAGAAFFLELVCFCGAHRCVGLFVVSVLVFAFIDEDCGETLNGRIKVLVDASGDLIQD